MSREISGQPSAIGKNGFRLSAMSKRTSLLTADCRWLMADKLKQIRFQ